MDRGKEMLGLSHIVLLLRLLRASGVGRNLEALFATLSGSPRSRRRGHFRHATQNKDATGR
jgi:hypothetical protein